LERLLLNADRPVQLIVAGKSHPADDGGKALIQQIVQFADRADLRHRIAFLPDYDMSMARLLYWGCDVWLNNPLRPLEACGTSGMKSAPPTDLPTRAAATISRPARCTNSLNRR
jgi:starch phosphorylase